MFEKVRKQIIPTMKMEANVRHCETAENCKVLFSFEDEKI